MSERAKVVLISAALLLILGGVAVWQLSGDPAPPAAPEPGAPRDSASEISPPPPLPELRGEEPEPGTDPRPDGPADPRTNGPSVVSSPPRPTLSGEPRAPGIVSGRVVSAGSGDPIEGVRVFLRRGREMRIGETDRDGAYRFEDVGPGMVVLHCFRPGFGPEHQVAVLTEGMPGVGGGLLELREVPPGETGAIEGHVIDGTGRAEAGIALVLHTVPPTFEIALETDEAGGFRLEGLPPRWYSMSVVSEEGGLWTRTRTAEVRAGETADLEIRGYGALTGVVTDPEGNPVEGALVSVSVVDLSGGPRRLQANSDAEGRYRIENAGLGEYRLWVYHAGTSAQIRIVNLSGSDQEEEISLPEGSLEGRIERVGARRTLRVALFPADPEAEDRHPLANTRSRPDGPFEFRWLEPGRYRLKVYRDRRAVSEATVEIPLRGAAEPVTVPLD